MFGSPLDNMLAQYSQYRRAEPTGAPSVAPTPTTPTRFFDQGGGQGFGGGGGSSQPGSFFSAANNVTAGGTSTGTSPFGQGIPNLSAADPATLARLLKGMQGLIYTGSGYIHGDHPAGPGTNYGPYYIGQPPKSDPTANRAAAAYYDYIGSLPTKPIGTPALNSLPGYSPTPGPSWNTKLGGAGPYGGPYSFPGWP